jgi:hypothetical protein
VPMMPRRRRTQAEMARARAKAVNARKHHLKTVHHMTMIEYEALLTFQNGKCYLCLLPPGKGKNLHVDHDHNFVRAPGSPCMHPHEQSCHHCWRGLVHRHCNDMLAAARDDIMVFIRGIEYLQNPPAQRWQSKMDKGC